jgi:hypothetical protein
VNWTNYFLALHLPAFLQAAGVGQPRQGLNTAFALFVFTRDPRTGFFAFGITISPDLPSMRHSSYPS